MRLIRPNPQTSLLEPFCFRNFPVLPVQDFGSLLMVSIFGPAGCDLEELAHGGTCPDALWLDGLLGYHINF